MGQQDWRRAFDAEPFHRGGDPGHQFVVGQVLAAGSLIDLYFVAEDFAGDLGHDPFTRLNTQFAAVNVLGIKDALSSAVDGAVHVVVRGIIGDGDNFIGPTGHLGDPRARVAVAEPGSGMQPPIHGVPGWHPLTGADFDEGLAGRYAGTNIFADVGVIRPGFCHWLFEASKIPIRSTRSLLGCYSFKAQPNSG